MRKPAFLIVMVPFALLFGARLLQASPPPVSVALVDLKFTVFSQVPNTTNGLVINRKIKKTPFSTRDVLNLLAKSLNTTFDPDAKLALVDFNFFVVFEPTKDLVTDISSVLSFQHGSTLSSGTENSGNGALRLSGNCVSTISFEDFTNGNVFSFSGITLDKYSVSAPDRYFQVTVQEALTISGAGEGILNGKEVFIASGRILGKGKVTDSPLSGTWRGTSIGETPKGRFGTANLTLTLDRYGRTGNFVETISNGGVVLESHGGRLVNGVINGNVLTISNPENTTKFILTISGAAMSGTQHGIWTGNVSLQKD